MCKHRVQTLTMAQKVSERCGTTLLRMIHHQVAGSHSSSLMLRARTTGHQLKTVKFQKLSSTHKLTMSEQLFLYIRLADVYSSYIFNSCRVQGLGFICYFGLYIIILYLYTGV